MQRMTITLAMASLTAVAPATQAPAADPWTRVPALTTSCLADDFTATIERLHETIKEELTKQEEKNSEVKQKFDEMDMMQKMQKMQAFMAKDPQKAMKVMQALQGGATTTSSDITSADESKTALEAQFEELETAFKEAAEAAAKPLRAKQGQFIGAKAENYAGGHRFTSKADQDTFMDLLRQEDAAYEKACAPFFGPDGKFHLWLGDYRTKVAMKVASGNDANDEIIATQIAMLDSPTAGYKPTGQLMGVREYLEKIGKVYDLRYRKAGPPQDLILIK